MELNIQLYKKNPFNELKRVFLFAKFMREFIYRNSFRLVILWWLVIFVLCATPGAFIPSANWMELLSLDKWIHAGIFFILTSLFIIQHKKRNQKRHLLVFYFFLCVVYGVSLEWMQARFFSGRYADWLDIIANTFGCFVALILVTKIRHYFSQIQV